MINGLDKRQEFYGKVLRFLVEQVFCFELGNTMRIMQSVLSIFFVAKHLA